ncbi:hypothetical protein EHF33_02460 [Deinococcus psychrotolerans]|uniref:Uncharacterized protein n=1 Tax=Deinococcus psychrotolerans TaxID=2489213 RepID=A0A3G8Y9Y4_9DEIO|nr:hypothetical protein [Deinococcus psychrotolerans]AZI41750.1 hypothetical protein EHF33_02460 [Deinococcus psychrotolerans]
MTTAAELNANWADQLSAPYRQVWQKMQAEGVSAEWTDDHAPRFVVSQANNVLASHLKGARPVGVVVPAALFEAGHKLEAENPERPILPAVASI